MGHDPTVTIGDPEGNPPTPPVPPEGPGALYFELGQAMQSIQALRVDCQEVRAEQDRLNGVVADLASTLSQTRQELAAVIVEEVQGEEELHQEHRAAWHERILGAG